MSDIISERSGHILRIQLNRPANKNAELRRHLGTESARGLTNSEMSIFENLRKR